SAIGSGTSGGTGSSSNFNVFSSEPPTPTPETAVVPGGETGTTDAGSAFSLPSYGPKETPPSFTVPGFYGQGSTTFFGGSGRLARPKFRMSSTFGFGYDDNVFATPSNNTPTILPGLSQIVDETGATVTVQPTETRTTVVQTGTTIGSGGLRRPVFETITTTVPIDVADTVIPAAERKGSMFARAGLSIEMQRYTRRSLFILNLSGADTYYFDKDEEPNEYSGNFDLKYLYRVTPRFQMTAQLNAAYISQPDLSRPNTPERQIQGDLINGLARLDLSYRFNPRLSTTFTTNFSANRYTEMTEQTGDFDEVTFGLEGRYLWKPRWTLLAELRYGMTTYLNRTDLDSTTQYFLVGSEFILSPRLSGSMRFGGAVKSFELGDTQVAPYVESSVMYRSTARSSVTWNNRFGFEEPGSPNQERLVYRGTIGYNYAFSPRLHGNLGVNLVHEISTTKGSDTDNVVDNFEATLGLQYEWTRQFSLSGSYVFNLSNTNAPNSDYYRSRVTLAGQYNF
ncbi:MAG: outer membrane beta-barrel protein, partial [Chthoniobacteraceae bacterium]